MNELDVLKQYWKQEENFPRVDQNAIRKMLYKSSSSIVKWIFLISVIEFIAGIALGVYYLFFDTRTPENHPLAIDILNYVGDTVSYLVIIYFIYQFFHCYRKIKNTSDTKTLLSDILQARRNVHRYIKFNVYMIVYSFAVIGISKTIEENLFDKGTGEIIMQVTLLIVVLFLTAWLFIALLKLYFRVIYIRLVKKLDRNYEELIRLEQGDDPHSKKEY